MTPILIALVIAGTLILSAVLAAVLLWRSAPAEDRAIVKRISRLGWRDKLRLATRLMRERRIALPVRVIPPLIVLYLAMPLDVIPDFIPILGQLDDMLVIALGVGLLIRFAPRNVVTETIDGLERASTRAGG